MREEDVTALGSAMPGGYTSDATDAV